LGDTPLNNLILYASLFKLRYHDNYLKIIIEIDPMKRVIIYSTGTCPLCNKAKLLFKKWNLDFQEQRVDLDKRALKDMLEITDHARTVPQIIIDNKWIGGFTELTELHMDGELDELINK